MLRTKRHFQFSNLVKTLIRPSETFYLTYHDKERLLAELALELCRGAVDKELLPYLERLNRLAAIATLFSCHGHGEKGYLSCLLDEKRHSAFFKQRETIARWQGVCAVEVDTYNNWNRICIRWRAGQHKAVLNALYLWLLDEGAYAF